MRARRTRNSTSDFSFAPARNASYGIKQEKQQIAYNGLDHKCDHLGKQHHKPSYRSAIEQKARPRAKKHGKAYFSVVRFVKQEDQ